MKVNSVRAIGAAGVPDVVRNSVDGRDRALNGLLSIVSRSGGSETGRVLQGTVVSGWGRRSRLKSPRQWLYATKPKFVRLRNSLVDALKEAEEVRLLLDLADFCSGDVCLEIKPDRYFVTAIQDEVHFAEEILLPKETDVSLKEEHFKEGILELVLPRKTEEGESREHTKGRR